MYYWRNYTDVIVIFNVYKSDNKYHKEIRVRVVLFHHHVSRGGVYTGWGKRATNCHLNQPPFTQLTENVDATYLQDAEFEYEIEMNNESIASFSKSRTKMSKNKVIRFLSWITYFDIFDKIRTYLNLSMLNSILKLTLTYRYTQCPKHTPKEVKKNNSIF